MKRPVDWFVQHILLGLLPFIGPWTVRKALDEMRGTYDADLERYKELAKSSDGRLDAPAKELWDAETERIRRLEDKLAGLVSFLTPFAPIVTAIGGLAVAKEDNIALAFAVAAGVEVVGAYRMASAGAEAVPTALIVSSDVEAAARKNKPDTELAALRMANAGYNVARGIDVSNRLSAARSAIFLNVAFLALALGELARRFLFQIGA